MVMTLVGAQPPQYALKNVLLVKNFVRTKPRMQKDARLPIFVWILTRNAKITSGNENDRMIVFEISLSNLLL
jgi:hypothetical protein